MQAMTEQAGAAMPATPEFGAHVRAVREAKGISLRRLAEQAGVDVSRLSKIERGIVPTPGRSDSRDLVVRLAQALGEDALRMLQLSGHEPRPDVKVIRQRPPFRELILTEKTLTAAQRQALLAVYESWTGTG